MKPIDDTGTETAKEDPVALCILACLADGRSISPQAAAKAFADGQSRPGRPVPAARYLQAVKQQAVHLARAGRIEILRKGRPVDPDDFKGVIRLRLATGG